MARADGRPAVCPICGSTLEVRARSLHCPSCDLVYEADTVDSDEADAHRRFA